MYIPDNILKCVQKLPTDNDKIYGAEQMYARLSSITRETYLDIDMAMVANCLELYYKGVLEASGLSVDPMLLNKSHSLNRLYQEITNRIIPLGNEKTPSEIRDMNMFLSDLSCLYIDARYHNAQTPFEDFEKCRAFVSAQREKCMSLLDPSRAWDKASGTREGNAAFPLASYEPSEDAVRGMSD